MPSGESASDFCRYFSLDCTKDVGIIPKIAIFAGYSVVLQ